MKNVKWGMRKEKNDDYDEKSWALRWEKWVWDEKMSLRWENEFEMRKWGLEVSKKDSFGVDGLDSKKHVKVLIFGCLRTR